RVTGVTGSGAAGRAAAGGPTASASAGGLTASASAGGVTASAGTRDTPSPLVSAPVPAAALDRHRAAVAAVRGGYAKLTEQGGADGPVRLAKRASNLFRFRDSLPGRQRRLDGTGFRRVLHVYPAARIAVAGGSTTYGHLAPR